MKRRQGNTLSSFFVGHPFASHATQFDSHLITRDTPRQHNGKRFTMGSMTIPLNRALVQDPTEKPALELLQHIQQYVEASHFTPTGVARGLGRKDANAVAIEFTWLASNDYLAYVGSDQYRLTTKGWAYGATIQKHLDDSDEDSE